MLEDGCNVVWLTQIEELTAIYGERVGCSTVLRAGWAALARYWDGI
jgi:hypothetical protein